MGSTSVMMTLQPKPGVVGLEEDMEEPVCGEALRHCTLVRPMSRSNQEVVASRSAARRRGQHHGSTFREQGQGSTGVWRGLTEQHAGQAHELEQAGGGGLGLGRTPGQHSVIVETTNPKIGALFGAQKKVPYLRGIILYNLACFLPKHFVLLFACK